MEPDSASRSGGWRGRQIERWGGVAVGSEGLAPRVEFVEPMEGLLDDESQAGPLEVPGGAGAGLPAFLKIGFERQAIVIDQRKRVINGSPIRARKHKRVMNGSVLSIDTNLVHQMVKPVRYVRSCPHL